MFPCPSPLPCALLLPAHHTRKTRSQLRTGPVATVGCGVLLAQWLHNQCQQMPTRSPARSPPTTANRSLEKVLVVSSRDTQSLCNEARYCRGTVAWGRSHAASPRRLPWDHSSCGTGGAAPGGACWEVDSLCRAGRPRPADYFFFFFFSPSLPLHLPLSLFLSHSALCTLLRTSPCSIGNELRECATLHTHLIEGQGLRAPPCVSPPWAGAADTSW